MQQDDSLAALETAVMDLQLSEDTPATNQLRAQWQAARVTSREFTGVGFYTNFEVPSSIPSVQGLDSRVFGDVYADIKGLQHGAGFLVWLEDGRLTCLEGYSYQEQWPQPLKGFRVRRAQPNSSSR